MSYIEREPLIKTLNGLYEHHLTMRNYAADGATFDCISTVIDAPTADVVEVRHGEWVDNHCSLCGMTPLDERVWKDLGLTPPKYEYCMTFCPICGAKMDGERREE